MDKTRELEKDNQPKKEEDTDKKEKVHPKISSLRRVPKTGTTNILRPSSTRFELDNSKKTEISPHIPISIFKQPSITIPTINSSKEDDNSKIPTKTKLESISVIPIQETKSSLPVTKSLLFSKDLSSKTVDKCSQLNFFLNKASSCYIDSLVFGLVHLQNNNFINELKTLLKEFDGTLPQSQQTCKTRIINFLIHIYEQIHDQSNPVKRILLNDLRELLYECDQLRSVKTVKFYKNQQQDVNEFLNIILNIISPNETIFTDVNEFSQPIGNRLLVENFRTYERAVDVNSYNTHLIYPQTSIRHIIDIGFTQIKDEHNNDIFGFILPPETDITYEMANGDYDFIVDYIYKNTLVDSNVIEEIRKNDPNLFDFFNPDITTKRRAELYALIYKKERIPFSEDYLYRDDLPKLTFKIQKNSKIYKNPLNYFVISILRENADGTRNNYDLINVPDRIQSYDKTLELVSAVIHIGQSSIGGHYICYFKCGDNWYIMDDMKTNIQYYAPFDITDKAIMTNCRLLIYM